MDYTLMENNVGFVRNVKNLFAGATKSTNKKEKEYGLIDGSLKAILLDSFLNKAVIAKPKSGELLTTGYPVLKSQIELILKSAGI